MLLGMPFGCWKSWIIAVRLNKIEDWTINELLSVTKYYLIIKHKILLEKNIFCDTIILFNNSNIL